MKNRRLPIPLPKGRAGVFEALQGQPDPVGIEALAQAIGRHPNTLREQLAWLVEQGFVVRVREQAEGRGRPAWLYETATGRPGQDDPGEVAAAIAWRLQETGEDDHEAALAAGREWGEELVAERGALEEPSPQGARRWTVGLLEDLDYDPDADEDCDEVVLRRCPLLQTAHRIPTVVCTVHLGVVQAALERNGGDPEAAELTPFSAPGECTLRLGR